LRILSPSPGPGVMTPARPVSLPLEIQHNGKHADRNDNSGCYDWRGC
jgi:hypothetical protein